MDGSLAARMNSVSMVNVNLVDDVRSVDSLATVGQPRRLTHFVIWKLDLVGRNETAARARGERRGEKRTEPRGTNRVDGRGEKRKRRRRERELRGKKQRCTNSSRRETVVPQGGWK